MKLAIIGSGYVGLVASGCFSALGHEVACVDRDAAKIAELAAGKITIHEPGLDAFIVKGLATGTLSFGTDLAAAVADAEVVFIAVGTPDGGDDGKPDLSNVYSVAREIAGSMQEFCVVVTKSTVPVGTGDVVERIISDARPDCDFAVVSNPEFLSEGRAVYDFNNPDRIVIGTECERGRAVMAKLYSHERFRKAPILFTSRRSAELVKYASNTFLAAKIAFINDMADLCERTCADIADVSRGMGLDSRIGADFLRAGPGFGGSCLPKDTRALVQTARQWGAPSGLYEAIVSANRLRKLGLARRVEQVCGGSLAGREIAVLGLTFKANTDDMRESPALALIPELLKLGALVRAYDPAGMTSAARMIEGSIRYTDDAYECAAGAHGVIVLTDWPEFRHLDMAKIKTSLADPIVIDFRNMFASKTLVNLGFAYAGVGCAAMLDGIQVISPSDDSRAGVRVGRSSQVLETPVVEAAE